MLRGNSTLLRPLGTLGALKGRGFCGVSCLEQTIYWPLSSRTLRVVKPAWEIFTQNVSKKIKCLPFFAIIRRYLRQHSILTSIEYIGDLDTSYMSMLNLIDHLEYLEQETKSMYKIY